VTGTSLPGYAKVVSVMAMEHVLRALTPASADLFNPERYCFKVFGTPGSAAWGWQLDGHHVSLNFTIVSGRYISPTPCLLGAEPAGYGTLAPLADDEELGYRFVSSLDAVQRRAAIIHHRPPPDLATRIVPRIGATERPDPVFGPGGCPMRWPGRRCTTSNVPGWITSPSPGRAAPNPGSGITSASRDLGCSSSTTTPRATATTSTRSGGTRPMISATTCWPSITAYITPVPLRR
jgi:hypothetical protein